MIAFLSINFAISKTSLDNKNSFNGTNLALFWERE